MDDGANFQFNSGDQPNELPLENVLSGTNGTLTVTDNVLDYTNTITNINSGIGNQQLTMALSSNIKSQTKNHQMTEGREISNNIQTSEQDSQPFKIVKTQDNPASIDGKIVLDVNRTMDNRQMQFGN